MCGGHAIHHLISLVTTEIEGPAKSAPYFAQAGSDSNGVENEVKLMYARGEISAEIFQRLRSMAQAHELNIQDLNQFHNSSANKPDGEAGTKAQIHESTLTFRHQLETRRGHLEAACAETEESIQRLQLEVVALYHKAESEDQNPEARTYTLSHAESAEQRIGLIRERLNHLKTSLADVVTQQRLLEG